MLAERLRGGLYGLLVGDAVGVPYEFRLADQIPPVEEIEFEPPKGYSRAHSGVPGGTWSDDGAQALCLLASLLHRGKLDVRDFGNRMVNWWSVGYMAVDGRVFDVGIQTTEALTAISQGADPSHAGGVLESENGNGSLMRVLPLSLFMQSSDVELVNAAEAQSMTTHGHARALVCCGVYALWARHELDGERLGLAEAVQLYRRTMPFDPVRDAELDRISKHGEGTGTGYVLDCLCSAATALEEKTFESVIKRAVAFGNDTDTTACVAGGIAGIRFGYNGIPLRWRTGLRGQDDFAQLLAELLDRRCA